MNYDTIVERLDEQSKLVDSINVDITEMLMNEIELTIDKNKLTSFPIKASLAIDKDKWDSLSLDSIKGHLKERGFRKVELITDIDRAHPNDMNQFDQYVIKITIKRN